MNTVPVRIIVGAALLVAIGLTALGCFGYALRRLRAEASGVQPAAWRRIATIIAFLAVATQAGVFLSFWIWPQIGRDYMMFSHWARWVFLPFFVALPCALLGKGSSRWWLLSSSVLLFVICFFIVLSA